MLSAAGQPATGRLRFVRQGLWRCTVGDADLALKLFDGPNAHERLRTEASLYQELCRVKAPVPGSVTVNVPARALSRAWVPGPTLYERLRGSDPLTQFESAAVRRAWLQLVQALAPWDARIAPDRRAAALRKRRIELAAVAQASAEAFPTVSTEAVHDLQRTVGTGEVAVLPLDASPSNVIVDGECITFIDLELVGLDFVDWTFAKYVTAVDGAGLVRSLPPGQSDAQELVRLDAAVTLLALARAAGLWDAPQIAPAALAQHLPGCSLAAGRIRAGLRLESVGTSDSG